MTIEAARRLIGERVEIFARNREQYRADEYKEAQLRREFLDPFFAALGWDVTNQQGRSEQSKEVINEDTVIIAGKPHAPAYSFRIGGVRQFFAEAKKSKIGIRTDQDAAYQLRRYAWSAQLPLSLLSDFEELAVYDCRTRPAPSDKAAVGRIAFFTFDQYLARLPEIYDVFSKEAVLRGSFDQYAREAKTKRGTSPVDAEFLKEIEGWRTTLAKNIAQLNPRMTLDELSDAVQRTIDRIIFLRMAEDRGAEEYGRLLRAANPLAPAEDAHLRALSPEQIVSLGALADTGKTNGGVYARLLALCRDADAKYNSGLFDFAADALTPQLKIDDDKLRGIITRLYFPQSPYEFSVLAADTLGNVYEQFLGKVIRLTPTHLAKIEEKPAVKNAGGVFYTPAYLVDYIVAQTLGKMIAGKSPAEIAGAGAANPTPLRVLDPACGAGAFLLGAYQGLLDHCLAWYAQNDAKRATREDKIFESATGWRLTAAEKKRILTTHIFGVDIDRQAVEATKLSLLLKMLEGETSETLGKQVALFKERALPNLDANIQCGNSLIGADYFAGQLLPEAAELRRMNPFDWAREFPEALRAGGFDVVLGNPPYIRVQTLKEWAPREVGIYKETYAAACAGNYDIYVVFVEKGLQLLKAGGRLGFILPHKFFNAKYGEPLRDRIARGKHLAHVVHFGEQQVFAGATTYTCLMFLDKAGSETCEFVKVDDLHAWRAERKATAGAIPAAKVTRAEWNFAVGDGAALFDKLSQMPVKLENVTSRIFQGIKTSADKIYIVEELDRKGNQVFIHAPAKGKNYWLETDLLHPLIKDGDSKRYWLTRTNRLILFPYSRQGDAVELVSESDFKARYPLTWAYLVDNKKYLESRENGKMRGVAWYRYGRNQALDVMPLPKIFTPDIAKRSAFSLDANGEAFFTGGVAGGYGILVLPEISCEYILALLNSHLLEWSIRQTAIQMRGSYFSYESRFIRGLPIRTINFDDAHDALRHRRIVALVEQMLDLHKRVASARTQAERDMFRRQIAATDAEIDALVYALYGLTEEEIRVVERGILDRETLESAR